MVRGRVGGELQELRTSISATATGDGTWVARLWARNHVNALMEEEAEYGADAERTNEYIALAVAYNFVTPHTAFLAIPASEVTANVRLTLDQVLAHKKAVLQEHREAAALLNPEDVAQRLVDTVLSFDTELKKIVAPLGRSTSLPIGMSDAIGIANRDAAERLGVRYVL